MHDAAATERHFVPRPARRFPAEFVLYVRRSLREGAGRIGRVWIEELYDEAEPAVTDWAIAVELRGDGLSERAFADADADVRARLLAAPGIDLATASVFVFEASNDGAEAVYFRAMEPLFGEAHTRLMRMADFAALAPHPRTLPETLTHAAPKEVDPTPWLTIAFLVLVAVGLGALVWWLVPGTGFWLYVRWGALLFIGLFMAATASDVWKTREGGAATLQGEAYYDDDELEAIGTKPLVLAGVVQARNELYDPEHGGKLDLMSYGLVAAYTLDPTWRNDPTYLGWLRRRLAWLRVNECGTADETRIAQRLESETDDRTRRLPASVTGNDHTYWATPYLRHGNLPNRVIPADGLLPLLLTSDDVRRPDDIDLHEVLPEALWPLRDRRPLDTPTT